MVQYNARVRGMQGMVTKNDACDQLVGMCLNNRSVGRPLLTTLILERITVLLGEVSQPCLILAFGILAGATFGAVAVAAMLPLSFPDKRAALTAAFVDRFAIGLVIGVVSLSWPPWFIGLFFGLLLSAPSAIVTRTWGPVLGFGALGGTIIGILLPHVTT